MCGAMGTKEAKASLESCEWLNLEDLRDATVLITGGTGLVGFNLLQELAQVKASLNIRILALVRNTEKAQRVFAPFLDQVELVCGDVREELTLSDSIDYIIHGASITSSKMFVENPVETIMTSFMGIRNMLELGRKKNVRSMVFLSSMEVYGMSKDDALLTEADVGYLNPLSIRSSYPESKRMSESLCVAYAKEYGVPVKIARLAQTFGPGMQPEDKRAIVQFLQSALSQKDIEIKASGESARMYLYTFDAVSALLTLLLYGEDGVAYNVANKATYCSIRTLAETIVEVTGGNSRVRVNTGTEEDRRIYPPDSFLRLDTSKLEALGWRASYDLDASIQNLAKCIGVIS